MKIHNWSFINMDYIFYSFCVAPGQQNNAEYYGNFFDKKKIINLVFVKTWKTKSWWELQNRFFSAANPGG